jgi:hypothetical protein
MSIKNLHGGKGWPVRKADISQTYGFHGLL